METPGPHVSRVNVEMSLGWADENPALFIQKFRDMGVYCPSSEWTHTLLLHRPGFVILEANRIK